MWVLVIPLVMVVGAVPFILRKRRQSIDALGEYAAVAASAERAETAEEADEADVEMGAGSGSDEPDEPDELPEAAIVLETMVCDVVEWLTEARSRLDIIDGPTLERVDTGSEKATRITFELKNGRREIYLDGPAFMQPLPRIRDLEWKSSDGGIEFERTAAGVEKAVLESYVKREP